jgi:hypothetical protein
MRTLRLSLVGTVILALLGGLSGAVLSQDELSGTATYIDGQRTYVSGDGDEPHRYDLVMSDDRASGSYLEHYTGVGHLYDGDSTRPSIVALDPVTLTNDDGSWSGLQSAIWDDGMGWRLTAWLAGEDAYEGLSLYLHAHRFPWYSYPDMDFDGIILEGQPPVMLEAISLPAE